MADKTTKVLEVIVDNRKAVSDIAEYNQLIDEQKAKQRQLSEEFKAGKITQTEYQAGMAKSKEEVKAYSRSVQELSKEIQNNIKDGQEQEGSLRSLRAQLSNLTKEFDALGRAERNGEAGRAKMEEINRITTELKEAEAETQRFYRNVGNYPDVKPLETQLGDIKKQLAQLKYEGKDNTEEFRELSAQAANMKDAIADVEQQINATASDTKNLDTAVSGLSTAIGGLSLLSNVFAEDSEEGKKLNEILLKAQKILAVLNTLRMIQNNTQKQGLLGQAAERVQLTATNALKRTQTSLTVAQTAATGAQTVAQRALNAATKAFPLFLLIGALTGLVALISKVVSSMNKASDNTAELEQNFERSKKAIDEYNKALDRTLSIMDKLGKSEASKMQTKLQGLINIAGQAKDLYRDSMELEEDKLKEAEQAYKDASTALNDYVEDLRAEVLTMGEMFDLMNENAGLQDFEIDIKTNNQELAEWTELLTNLLSIGKISSTEADKAFRQIQAKTEKANKEILAKRFKEEVKYQKDLMRERLAIMREAQDIELSLMKEGTEKEQALEKARINQVWADINNREIEASLTLTGSALKKQLDALKELKNAEMALHVARMAMISQEGAANEQNKKAETLRLKLESVTEGSQEELELKLQLLEEERLLETVYAQRSEDEKALINATYRKKEEELRREHNNRMIQEAQEAVALEWQNKINEAANQGKNVLQLEIDAAKARQEALQKLEGESDAEFKERQLAAEREYLDAKKNLADYELEIEQAKYDALESMIGGLSQIIAAFGDENEKWAKAGKILALGEIAVNTGKAIAAGIAQAAAAGPWPANIAAIGTTVATVLTNIATAVSTVKSAKFATGGIVTGPGTGTSDSIPARLSNGESVINARSTAMFSPILSALNQAGGGVAFNPVAGGQEGFAFLASAIETGMNRANVRVGVDEITRVTRRVESIKETSRI